MRACCKERPEELKAELERLRSAGAGFIAFTWFTFWWLEHYPDFSAHLWQRFPCTLSNERLLVFDLRGGDTPARFHDV